MTVSYDVAPEIHAYATYARSFKSGGINLSGLPLNSTSTGVGRGAAADPVCDAACSAATMRSVATKRQRGIASHSSAVLFGKTVHRIHAIEPSIPAIASRAILRQRS